MKLEIKNGCIIVTENDGHMWITPLVVDGDGVEMKKYTPTSFTTEFVVKPKSFGSLNDALRLIPHEGKDTRAILRFTLTNGEVASALRVADNTYIMLDCIGKSAMDSDENFHGTYAESELRRKLQGEYLDLFPQELRDRMVPWENGDLLRLPKAEELFTNDELDERDIPYDKSIERWSVMEDPRNRIAMWKGEPAWYWCENKCSAAYFAVCYSYGIASRSSAAYVGGVRPAFAVILNPKSPPLHGVE